MIRVKGFVLVFARSAKLRYVSLLLAVAVFSCGKGGKTSSNSVSGSGMDVKGSIAGQTGNSSELEGWTIALIDAATGESRTSEIAADGTFSIKSARSDKTYTLALFNLDYRFTAILSAIAVGVEGKVYQYFKLKSSDLSRIVFKGQILEFGNADVVTMQLYTAKDQDNDGIPDGLDSSATLAVDAGSASNKSLPTFSLSESDTDGDGVANGIDPDIDGDGIPNILDTDDDGNGTLDVFDLDANSDLVLDASQKIGDSYFGDGVDFALAQIFLKSDGTLNLRFSAKVTDGADKPNTVSILGSNNFLDESRTVARSSSGTEEAKDIWDKKLRDAGETFDDAADDGLYSAKVKIKAGKSLKANQVFFIRLDYGSYTRDFPYMFPDLELDDISFSYASSRVTKSGSPFGSGEENYLWSVSVYNSDGALVHSSSAIDGTEDRYSIPSGELDSGESYTARVYAQSLEKVQGFPVYIIESEEGDL